VQQPIAAKHLTATPSAGMFYWADFDSLFLSSRVGTAHHYTPHFDKNPPTPPRRFCHHRDIHGDRLFSQLYHLATRALFYSHPIWYAWQDKLLPILDRVVACYRFRQNVYPKVMLARLEAKSIDT